LDQLCKLCYSLIISLCLHRYWKFEALPIGVQARGLRGGAAAPPVSEIFETFEQNADDSGKSTEDKTF